MMKLWPCVTYMECLSLPIIHRLQNHTHDYMGDTSRFFHLIQGLVPCSTALQVNAFQCIFFSWCLLDQQYSLTGAWQMWTLKPPPVSRVCNSIYRRFICTLKMEGTDPVISLLSTPTHSSYLTFQEREQGSFRSIILIR